jgi:hypothetical protein
MRIACNKSGWPRVSESASDWPPVGHAPKTVGESLEARAARYTCFQPSTGTFRQPQPVLTYSIPVSATMFSQTYELLSTTDNHALRSRNCMPPANL